MFDIKKKTIDWAGRTLTLETGRIAVPSLQNRTGDLSDLAGSLTGTVNGSPYETRFATVSTEVTVSDGQTVTIGTDAKDSDFYSRFLIGATLSGGTRRLNITLTPHIFSFPQSQIPGPGPRASGADTQRSAVRP